MIQPAPWEIHRAVEDINGVGWGDMRWRCWRAEINLSCRKLREEPGVEEEDLTACHQLPYRPAATSASDGVHFTVSSIYGALWMHDSGFTREGQAPAMSTPTRCFCNPRDMPSYRLVS